MSRELTRRDALKGAAAAGTIGLAGCLDSITGGGGGGRTVQQGILMPETGDLASVGQPIRDGATLPLKQLQDADTGFSYDFQVGDTQTNPQAGISAAENLVNAGYPAITGPASSGVNLQVTRQVLIPNQVVGCSPSSTALSVSDLEDDDVVFRTAPSDRLQGRVMAQVMAERLDGSTVSTLYVENDYGRQLSARFTSVFEADSDGEVFRQVAYDLDEPSYTSVVDRALGDGGS